MHVVFNEISEYLSSLFIIHLYTLTINVISILAANKIKYNFLVITFTGLMNLGENVEVVHVDNMADERDQTTQILDSVDTQHLVFDKQNVHVETMGRSQNVHVETLGGETEETIIAISDMQMAPNSNTDGVEYMQIIEELTPEAIEQQVSIILTV